MVIGLPLVSSSVIRVSGLVKRITEIGASQIGVVVSPRAAIGKARVAIKAAAAIDLKIP
jgi:hypothetical protein